ncbi:acetylornithine transaminase [Niallia endozanthoxylica]|uniref:Acetylornithine aminotransferase n=1 Tax=Niallia endozanthoxylica TaxID=2036016 RepID=A0A5J5HZJ0_9BACI|nr:acetylornithine transaminase [Niallia endozanthoxylica]KAA9027540.1 acetylornithine transaminase [Niallia endozanthoxylica]
MSSLFPTYSRWEIEPDWAEGSIMYGKDGKKYLDYTSGIGVCNLGHRPKVVEEAIQEQLKKFWHVSNLFPVEIQETAAAKLAQAAEMDLVFFSNSGAEANEAAIKLSRKATGRSKIITFNQSFHGRTYATMSATGQDKIKHGFGPMLETFIYVPFNDLAALKEVMSDEVAAVMLEVIQGEGGIHPASKEFLDGVEALCKEYGSLLVIDEIQTGIGRTGKPFAFQHYGLKPDIVSVAKGLGSGLPIGGIIAKGNLKDVFGPGSHGTTFGGNPLSVSSALATMDAIFQDSFLAEVNEKADFFRAALEENLLPLPNVNEIRGIGMMIGIEINQNVPDLLKNLRSNGFIALPAGENVIRLLPPLTTTKSELEEAIDILTKVLTQNLGAAV